MISILSQMKIVYLIILKAGKQNYKICILKKQSIFIYFLKPPPKKNNMSLSVPIVEKKMVTIVRHVDWS